MRVLREAGSITNKFETNVSQYGNGEAYSEVVNSKGYAKEAKEHRDVAEAAKLEALLAAEKAKESEVNAKASERLSEAFKDITEANVAITEENAQEATEQAIRSEVAANTSSEASIEASVYAATASTEANNSLLYANQAKGYKDQAEGFSIASEASSVASAVSAAEAGGYTEEVKEIYEAYAKGAVYRGGWNPMQTTAYPNPQATNSYWDVYLNQGYDSFTWNGISWSSGDRLIYSVPDNQYFHIKSAGGVSSVNGKSGSVNLAAADVGALPSKGDASINDGSLKVTDFNNNGEIVLRNYFGNSYIQSSTRGGSSNDLIFSKSRTINSPVNAARFYVQTGLYVNDNPVYHPNNKPTAEDVGAISSADNNNIDIRARFKGLVVGDANQASQVSYGDIWQFTPNGSPRTLVGSSSSRGQYAGFQWNNSAKTFTLQHSSAGDVITLDANGHATMLNDPTSAKHIATKSYVDSVVGSGGGSGGSVIPELGKVGSYALLCFSNGLAEVAPPGSTKSGADLKYASAAGSTARNTVNGSWKCMGATTGYEPDDPKSVTLFVRIA